ncbi:HDOD domain-containing protein [Maioricimonas sp. JC845]|uniref:protein kinase domain-containing protein n=1 Tax=Maioricimonas sp. JC845 TaxID=3232138 RepID=UPI0034583D3F
MNESRTDVGTQDKMMQTPVTSDDWTEVRQAALEGTSLAQLPRRIRLPVIPQAAIRFTHLAEDPSVSHAELAETLETDSTLTTELLRYVNSAKVGARQRIHSVRQALAAIGIRRSKTLVLMAALQNAVCGIDSPLFPAALFQRDNQERALFAREFARMLGVDEEMAYTAGMLQDLLLPFLTAELPTTYRRFSNSKMSLTEFEQEEFGWNHAAVTGLLMTEWGFPDELVCSVIYHHRPQEILENEFWRESTLPAVASSAALPGVFEQMPSGLEILLNYQEEFDRFRFIEIAAHVDEMIGEEDRLGRHRIPLCERLGTMAMNRLEHRRHDVVVEARRVGNYTLEKEIGKGAMGVVYRARHDMLERPVALKLLNAASVSPSTIVRFEKEVQLTSRLTCPNTIGIYDYGVTPEGLFYYAMEYLDGMTLRQLVRHHGPQSEGRVINLLLQACNSIIESHAHDLIHRDLKPENLMLSNRGGQYDVLKVLDFGLAKLMDDGRPGDSSHYGLSGTPLYMPPEAVMAPETVDERSDIYSLGAVGYFLLTGVPVFEGESVTAILRKQVEAMPIPPSVRGGRSIDAELQAIIMDCLEKDRRRRPESARELVMRLQRCRRAHEWTQAAAEEWWDGQPDAVERSDETDPFAKTICQRDTECISAAETKHVERIPRPDIRAESE